MFNSRYWKTKAQTSIEEKLETGKARETKFEKRFFIGADPLIGDGSTGYLKKSAVSDEVADFRIFGDKVCSEIDDL